MKELIGLTIIVGLCTAVYAGEPDKEELVVEEIQGDFPINPKDLSGDDDGVSFSDTEEAVYEAHKGDRLSDTLERWCGRVGYDLVWQPGPDAGDLELAGSITFNASFKNATRQFMELVSQQSKFDAQLHPNKVLRVFVTGE